MSSLIRNLGIIAHIDAGKTTLTERMLFQAGKIKRVGSVDDGDTVTDYLPQERERGITIVSAAVTFPWRQWQFNLIDTPGHVDFTMEVERSLRVLDGAVAVLDARAGVQSQTRTVWKQADKHEIARLIFINKLDKIGADWEGCLSSIERRLGVEPLPLQWPEGDMVDLIQSPGPRRTRLIEQLAMHDDVLLEKFLANEIITTPLLQQSIARACRAGKVVPVLGGSAIRMVGVQPLMDAIGLYLPPPPPLVNCTVCKALAFKVIVDPQRGPITFVRVYEGRLERGMCLWRQPGGLKERPNRLLRAFADSYEEVDAIAAGDIGVLLGLKHTRSGDTLSFRKEDASLPGISIPPPVIHCAVEAGSQSEEERLESMLANLHLEDPSLVYHREPESGQLILAGMGELHLEIVRSRILDTAKIDAQFGEVKVSLREGPINLQCEQHFKHHLHRELAGIKLEATVSLALSPANDGEEILIPASFNSTQADALRQGLQATYQSGPLGHPLTGINCRVTEVIGDDLDAIRQAAAESLMQALRQIGTQSYEPIMSVTLSAVPESKVGDILTDLHSIRRRGQLVQLSEGGLVEAEIPLSCLSDYSAMLRSVTGGEASIDMHFKCYRPVL